MKDTYNDGYKTEDIKCIIVDFIAEDGKGGLPIMRQGTYILCKDCKYWNKYIIYENDKKCICQCEDNNAFWGADDFCSRGVRR